MDNVKMLEFINQQIYTQTHNNLVTSYNKIKTTNLIMQYFKHIEHLA